MAASRKATSSAHFAMRVQYLKVYTNHPLMATKLALTPTIATAQSKVIVAALATLPSHLFMLIQDGQFSSLRCHGRPPEAEG